MEQDERPLHAGTTGVVLARGSGEARHHPAAHVGCHEEKDDRFPGRQRLDPGVGEHQREDPEDGSHGVDEQHVEQPGRLAVDRAQEPGNLHF